VETNFSDVHALSVPGILDGSTLCAEVLMCACEIIPHQNPQIHNLNTVCQEEGIIYD
jgi:hypothetical protein